MNKTDLINVMSDTTGMTKNDTRRIVDLALTIISERLAAGEKVTLSGFGTFNITEKEARTGINPRTKEAIVIPPHRIVKFRTGIDLLEMMNESDVLSPAVGL